MLLLVAWGQAAPAEPLEAMAELAAASKAYDTAISRRDMAALEKILAPGAVFTTATGRVMERAAVLEMLAQLDTHYETLESGDIRRRINGNVAVETGRVRVRGKRKGQPVDETQRYTDVWQKTDGRWRLIAEHTSLVPQETR
jgi:ketosteroid isomerase-like protein